MSRVLWSDRVLLCSKEPSAPHINHAVLSSWIEANIQCERVLISHLCCYCSATVRPDIDPGRVWLSPCVQRVHGEKADTLTASPSCDTCLLWYAAISCLRLALPPVSAALTPPPSPEPSGALRWECGRQLQSHLRKGNFRGDVVESWKTGEW